MTRKGKKLILFAALGYVAYWIYKKRQGSVMPGALAVTAGAPSTAVSPTAAPTTANMKALAGLAGGYINR